MALDELHARRLATVFTILEGALERIESLMRSSGTAQGTLPLSAQQIHRLGEKIEAIRKRIRQASERFSIRCQKPPVRQVLAAELSTLWVTLENARPRRMKGYGRKFDPEDKAQWEQLIQDLMNDVEEMRTATLGAKPEIEGGKPSPS
jgi:hypothetical protein